MDFAYTLRMDGVDFGMIPGDDRLVLIKVGLGGDCYGHGNKYLQMAAYLQERYHCSVIVASNPNDAKDHMQADLQAVAWLAEQCRMEYARLLFFGNSNGGVCGLALAQAGVPFEKMVLVNLPLMINLHKTKRALTEIKQTQVLVVYGEKDPSFSYIPFVDGRFSNLQVQKIPGADHNFQGLSEVFLHLSDWLFT